MKIFFRNKVGESQTQSDIIYPTPKNRNPAIRHKTARNGFFPNAFQPLNPETSLSDSDQRWLWNRSAAVDSCLSFHFRADRSRSHSFKFEPESTLRSVQESIKIFKAAFEITVMMLVVVKQNRTDWNVFLTSVVTFFSVLKIASKAYRWKFERLK